MRLLHLRSECNRLASTGCTVNEIVSALDVHPLTAMEAVQRVMRRKRAEREQAARKEIKEQLEGSF